MSRHRPSKSSRRLLCHVRGARNRVTLVTALACLVFCCAPLERVLINLLLAHLFGKPLESRSSGTRTYLTGVEAGRSAHAHIQAHEQQAFPFLHRVILAHFTSTSSILFSTVFTLGLDLSNIGDRSEED